MKNIVKLGLLALVATAASLQAYDEVTIQKLINELPGNPEIAYRITGQNDSVVQDWTQIFTDPNISTLDLNLTLKREPDGSFQKVEFKKVGYGRMGTWNLQPYGADPSEFYQPSGSNRTLSIGLQEYRIKRYTGTTGQQARNVRVVKLANPIGSDDLKVSFFKSEDERAPIAEYTLKPAEERTINFLAPDPLYYKISSGFRGLLKPLKFNSFVDPVFIDKDGAINMVIKSFDVRILPAQ